jgi:5-methylcytosine-specific restriction endonuclease McrA
MVLRRDPLCVGWPAGVHGGSVVGSNTADHIIPLHAGGTWALTNGQGLCESCHGVKCNEEQARGR